MLAGVVELVLRLTIAEEKIELSVPISSSCVCVSDYMHHVYGWLLVCVSVCVRVRRSGLCLCVQRLLQRRAQL